MMEYRVALSGRVARHRYMASDPLACAEDSNECTGENLVGLWGLAVASHWLAADWRGRKDAGLILHCGLGTDCVALHAGDCGVGQSKDYRVVSGRDKAERIAAQYGVPKSAIYDYQNYDEIAAQTA